MLARNYQRTSCTKLLTSLLLRHLFRLEIRESATASFLSKMSDETGSDANNVCPPALVRGMRTLDRSLFAKTVRVPCLLVDQRHLQSALKLVKSYLLKMDNLKAVQDNAIDLCASAKTEHENLGCKSEITDVTAKISDGGAGNGSLDTRINVATKIEAAANKIEVAETEMKDSGTEIESVSSETEVNKSDVEMPVKTGTTMTDESDKKSTAVIRQAGTSDRNPIHMKRKSKMADRFHAEQNCQIKDASPAPVMMKKVLLNSSLVPANFADLPSEVRSGLLELGISHFSHCHLALDYRNFKYEDVLTAVLPVDGDKTTAYSRVGHIVHLNLRSHLTDYRHLIGQVLLDKLSGITLVVNKTDAIGNEYRNFEMEVLAGELPADKQMITTVRENGCSFEFDFARVFWNPRLCTEHERLVGRLESGAVLYDVFAGVGPFAVPAARSKNCRVLANDLNPDSYKWLRRNLTLNRVTGRVVAYNLDGRMFLREIVRADMITSWLDYKVARSKLGRDDEDVSVTRPNLHVVMNLPALAVQFLDAFIGLLVGDGRGNPDVKLEPVDLERELNVHCYTFAREEDFVTSVPALVESVLDCRLDPATTETFHVRSVAPNKEMIRISFRLPTSVLFRVAEVPSTGEGGPEIKSGGRSDVGDGDEPSAKRLRADLPLQSGM